MAKLNIVETRSFIGKGTVLVVLIKTQYSGYKAFIGSALEVNEDYDAHFVIEFGTKLPRHLAAAHFPKKVKEGVLYDGRTEERPKGRRNTKSRQP